MYRDLLQVESSLDIPADTNQQFGPYTLFNTRAFLIQVKSITVPSDTEFRVYLSTDFSMGGGTSASPAKPDVNAFNTWVLVHSNTEMVTTEPLVYEKCQSSAEWLKFEIETGSGGSMDSTEIVLARQAWR